MKNKDQQLIWETYLKEEEYVQQELPGTPERPALPDDDRRYVAKLICDLVITYRDTGFDQAMAGEWIKKTFEQGENLKHYGWPPEFAEILNNCFANNWH
tara:strand:+ start:230 stop:526 length:297 start_codon:yes stop_codon:yes gene_type:complete